MIDPDRDSFLEHEVHPNSPTGLHVDFDFSAVEAIPESEKDVARQQMLQFVEEVLKWIIEDMERERESSVEYRVAAMAWVMRRPMFDGKTLLQVAEERNLNRVVLHRHIANFTRRFRMRNKQGKA